METTTWMSFLTTKNSVGCSGMLQCVFTKSFGTFWNTGSKMLYYTRLILPSEALIYTSLHITMEHAQFEDVSPYRKWGISIAMLGHQRVILRNAVIVIVSRDRNARSLTFWYSERLWNHVYRKGFSHEAVARLEDPSIHGYFHTHTQEHIEWTPPLNPCLGGKLSSSW